MLTATNDERVSFNSIVAYLTIFLACTILGFFCTTNRPFNPFNSPYRLR
jgi:hypothetical protein